LYAGRHVHLLLGEKEGSPINRSLSRFHKEFWSRVRLSELSQTGVRIQGLNAFILNFSYQTDIGRRLAQEDMKCG
jgi:hypothetical protein